jgi:hypothetical protein
MGHYRLRKNPSRSEAGIGGRRGFQPPHKASKFNAGFSPGGMHFVNVTLLKIETPDARRSKRL